MANKGCSNLTAPKLRSLILCVAIVIVVGVAAQLHILRSFDKHTGFLRRTQSDSSSNLLLDLSNRTTWRKGTFCYDFVLETHQNTIPVCGRQATKSDQVRCYVSNHTKNMAMCSYKNLAMKPRQMMTVIPTDSNWSEPSNRTINLLQNIDSQVKCTNFSIDYLLEKTNHKNFEVKLTKHLLASERLSPVVCDSWVNKTTFFHVSNGFHIYFRFLDLYNVHKALLDYNRTYKGQVIRIGNMADEYIFPEFDKALFPGAMNLNDFKGNGTICFKEVILVPRSYQSVPFQCKMNNLLKKLCFECNGKELTGSPLNTFRTRVLKACNITQASYSGRNSHVVVVSRRPYKRWPGDDVSKFKRVLSNEALMVAEIKKAFPKVSVDVVHMEDLDICEQVRYAVEADVMLGVHGAGLVHFWWLRDEATAFELEPMFQTTNPTFRMLTTLTGRNYASELIGGQSTEVSVNIAQLISSIKKLL